MFQETGQFDLQDVAEAITHKMVRRHPHVFEDRTVSGTEEVIQNWHKIKLNERKSSPKAAILDSVPASLPSLMRAYRVSDRAAKSGIDWTELSPEFQNPEDLLQRIEAALQQEDEELRSQEFGRVLFALVNICRREKIHPETALVEIIHEFEQKVKKMQDLTSDSKSGLADLSPEQKAEIWRKIDHH